MSPEADEGMFIQENKITPFGAEVFDVYNRLLSSLKEVEGTGISADRINVGITYVNNVKTIAKKYHLTEDCAIKAAAAFLGPEDADKLKLLPPEIAEYTERRKQAQLVVLLKGTLTYNELQQKLTQTELELRTICQKEADLIKRVSAELEKTLL